MAAAGRGRHRSASIPTWSGSSSSRTATRPPPSRRSAVSPVNPSHPSPSHHARSPGSEKPATYFVCTEDLATPAEAQRQRVRADTRLVEFSCRASPVSVTPGRVRRSHRCRDCRPADPHAIGVSLDSGPWTPPRVAWPTGARRVGPKWTPSTRSRAGTTSVWLEASSTTRHGCVALPTGAGGSR